MNPSNLILALCLIATVPLSAHAQSDPEIELCIARNKMEPGYIRAARISTRDRAGFDRDTVIKIFGRTRPDGMRELLVHFIEPDDVKGSAFLMRENATGTEMWFRAGPDEKAKRIEGAGRLLRLLGTDFSYEDFEQMIAFDHPKETKRLDDTTLRRRAVYVVETRPAADEGSAYERVVTFIDKEKCVALRIELYEKAKGLRKTLMVNPAHLHQKGDLWIPQFMLMEDLVDYTTTVFMIDSTQQDIEQTDEAFRKEGLALSP
jgi:hypothetical protein